MKVNIFLTIIGLLLASLIAYLNFSIAEGKQNDSLCGFVSAVCYIATLVSTLGIQITESPRQTVNLRVMSVLFFVIFAIVNFCFAIFGIVQPYYFLINGILLLIFVLLTYKLSKITNV